MLQNLWFHVLFLIYPQFHSNGSGDLFISEILKMITKFCGKLSCVAVISCQFYFNSLSFISLCNCRTDCTALWKGPAQLCHQKLGQESSEAWRLAKCALKRRRRRPLRHLCPRTGISGACPGSLLLTISILIQEALSYTSCNGLESDYSTSD